MNPVKFKACESIQVIIGCIILIFGLAIVFGWVFNIQPLVEGFGTRVPMEMTSAICFLLSGIALTLINNRYYLLYIVIACVIAFIALLTLAEYAFKVSLFIDTLFSNQDISNKGFYPGRMALNTALSFVLTAVLLIIFSIKSIHHFYWLKGIIAFLVFICGFLAIVGYAFDIDVLYGWFSYTRMAIHSAIGFVLIGISFFLATLYT